MNKIALVVDSNSQIPSSLAQRYDIRVVPLTIVVDGREYAEHTELSTARFYELLEAGAAVSTSAPSPGEFVKVYEAAAADGASEILSVHLGSSVSATFSAATLAARIAPVPVRLVDTGTASFAVTLCAWAGAEALRAGASVGSAAERAASVTSRVGNVFVMRAFDLAAKGGRLGASVDTGTGAVPVLALRDGKIVALDTVRTAEAAIDAMVSYVVESAGGQPVRLGIGEAGMAELSYVFEERLLNSGVVAELVRYELGPSVGAHTGWGTLGACFAPLMD